MRILLYISYIVHPAFTLFLFKEAFMFEFRKNHYMDVFKGLVTTPWINRWDFIYRTIKALVKIDYWYNFWGNKINVRLLWQYSLLDDIFLTQAPVHRCCIEKLLKKFRKIHKRILCNGFQVQLFSCKLYDQYFFHFLIMTLMSYLSNCDIAMTWNVSKKVFHQDLFLRS